MAVIPKKVAIAAAYIATTSRYLPVLVVVYWVFIISVILAGLSFDVENLKEGHYNTHYSANSGSVAIILSLLLTAIQFWFERNADGGDVFNHMGKIRYRMFLDRGQNIEEARMNTDKQMRELEKSAANCRSAIFFNAIISAIIGEFFHGFGPYCSALLYSYLA